MSTPDTESYQWKPSDLGICPICDGPVEAFIKGDTVEHNDEIRCPDCGHKGLAFIHDDIKGVNWERYGIE